MVILSFGGAGTCHEAKVPDLTVRRMIATDRIDVVIVE